jgi:hypothetical protein
MRIKDVGHFSAEALVPSKSPVSSADKSAIQPLGISMIHDSFESAANKQGELIKKKQQLEEQDKKLEEQLKETQDSSRSFWGFFKSLFGYDDGRTGDYETQQLLNTYNDAEKSSERAAKNLNSAGDDVKKHLG